MLRHIVCCFEQFGLLCVFWASCSILISQRHLSPLFSILIISGFYFYIYCFGSQHKWNHQIFIFWLFKLNLMAFEIKQICTEVSHRKTKKPRLLSLPWKEIISGLSMWSHLYHFLWLTYLNSNVEITLAFLFSVLTCLCDIWLEENCQWYSTFLMWEMSLFWYNHTLTFNLVWKVTVTLEDSEKWLRSRMMTLWHDMIYFSIICFSALPVLLFFMRLKCSPEADYLRNIFTYSKRQG